MNPDKLFDYLDGRLAPSERADFEGRLISDAQLQRELAVARRIHSGMRGESREVELPDTAITERGRKMALRVGGAFIILMAVNVGAGLWIIAHKESKNPNHALLEKQTRDQIKKSLEHAAVSELAPAASLGVSELTISASPGKLNSVADDVVAAASRAGGSATKGIPDQHRVSVLADVPANREPEFRGAISAIAGGAATTPVPGDASAPAAEKKSFVIQIVEPAATTPK
ncbi:MAG: hypothetical protein ABI925_10525 [Verrucomicrobiota bacterium]